MPTTLKTTWRWFLLVVLLIAAADAALMIMHHRAAMTAELAKTGAKEQDVYWAALGSRMQDALSALEAAAVEAAEDASIRRLVVQGRRAVDEEGGGEGGEESAKIRSDLLKELVDRWGIFTRYYPVDHVHVYLPPDQTVFLRVPNSSNFGDALGDRARVVAKAAAQGVPVNGFEAGPAYAGLRAAAPIMAQSSDSNESFMAGVVEVGVGMGPLLEKLKNDMGVDAALLLSETGPGGTVSSGRTGGERKGEPWAGEFYLDSSTAPTLAKLWALDRVKAAVRQAVQSESMMSAPYSTIVRRNDEPYLVITVGIRDFGSEEAGRMPVGAFVTWMPVPEYDRVLAKVLTKTLVLAAAFFVVALGLLYLAWRMASAQLTRLVREQTSALQEQADQLEEKTKQLNFANRRLARTEKRYRSMYENAVLGMFRSRLDGRLVHINPSMTAILGYDSPEDLLSQPSSAHLLVANDDQREKWRQGLAESGELRHQEMKLRRRDGSEVWVITNVRLIQDDDGREILEGSLTEITARKEAEEELRRREEMLRRIIETTSEGFALLDYQRRIMGVNEALVRMLGYSREELVGRLLDDLYDKSSLDFSAANRDHLDVEAVFLAADGRRRPMLYHRSALRGDDDAINSYVCFLTDLTEIKAARDELRRAREKANQASGDDHDS